HRRRGARDRVADRLARRTRALPAVVTGAVPRARMGVEPHPQSHVPLALRPRLRRGSAAQVSCAARAGARAAWRRSRRERETCALAAPKVQPLRVDFTAAFEGAAE